MSIIRLMLSLVRRSWVPRRITLHHQKWKLAPSLQSSSSRATRPPGLPALLFKTLANRRKRVQVRNDRYLFKWTSQCITKSFFTLLGDVFTIDELAIHEGEQPGEQTYAVAGDILDGVSQQLLSCKAFNYPNSWHSFAVHVRPADEFAWRAGRVEWICGEAEWLGYQAWARPLRQLAGEASGLRPGQMKKTSLPSRGSIASSYTFLSAIPNTKAV